MEIVKKSENNDSENYFESIKFTKLVIVKIQKILQRKIKRF